MSASLDGSILLTDEGVHGTEVWNGLRVAISWMEDSWMFQRASCRLAGYRFDWVDVEDFAFLVIIKFYSGAEVLAWVVHKAIQLLEWLAAVVLLSTFSKLSSLVEKLLGLEIRVILLLFLTHLRNVKLQSNRLFGRRLANFFQTVVA